MTRFRLRYQSTDLDLPEGEFVLGRSSACHLKVDDPLVSRRHAVLRVSVNSVRVEDLKSRNGLLLNGEPFSGSQKLSHLDRIGIGGQEVVLLDVGESANKPANRTLKIDVPDVIDAMDDEPESHETTLTLAEGIALKALAMGRFEEAERILTPRLLELRQEAESGQNPHEARVAESAECALQLARGLNDTKWLDWVFEVHLAIKRPVSSTLVDRLHAVVRELKYGNLTLLRDYLDVLRSIRSQLTPPERFVLQRLEGLEGVVSA